MRNKPTQGNKIIRTFDVEFTDLQRQVLALPPGAVFADVSCDFPSAHGVSDQRDAGQIQGAQQSIEIGRERIVIVHDAGVA